MKLKELIEQHWYQKADPILSIILFPFSLIYELIIRTRKLMFTLKLKSSSKLNVPVVIIGNIGVGGAGKTPLAKHLAQQLTAAGIEVGIILRGYKASDNAQARIVEGHDDSSEVGDEALIYAQAGIKVAIGSKRVAAGQALLAKYPEIKLILADDGMQHYYLARDMEICVIDSTRIFGNQQLLPMGPLREPVSRLKQVDAIVINGKHHQDQINKLLQKYAKPVIWQELAFECFYNPVTEVRAARQELNGQKIAAMAAIGNPYRFFNYLRELGVEFNKVRAFPDHYSYKESDIPEGYTIITTEKDYTKLTKFKNKNIWVAQVSAKLSDPTLIEKIQNLVK